jgi:5-methylcytosine-specific restriction endonuclease McrA
MNNRQEFNKFYNSRAWKKVRWIVLHKYRGICQRCGMRGFEVHHVIPLTSTNVHDASISLNPDNLMLLCTSCHNAMRSPESEVRNDVMFNKAGDLTQKAGPPHQKAVKMNENGRGWSS